MSSNNTELNFSLKDKLINRRSVAMMANQLAGAVPDFNVPRFIAETIAPFEQLELKQRVAHIAETLVSYLDPNFRVAAQQITVALPPELDPSLSDNDFGEFILTAFAEFVVRNGLSKQHVVTSLRTLKEITKRCTSEYAIRYFLNQHPVKTMATLDRWADDENYHVRRLVSEGTRPKLPWGCKLLIDPNSVVPLLIKLHADPTRYVTRSVSNHLNDLSKIEPNCVVNLLKEWTKAGKQDSVELQWMSRHALRTLIKQGDAGAMRFLGFRRSPKVTVQNFRLEQTELKIGQTLTFDFELTATRPEKLIVDYVIYFKKSNGTKKPKVHKIKQLEMKSGQKISIQKRHSFKSNATTFRLYPGTHEIALQINGSQTNRLEFQLD